MFNSKQLKDEQNMTEYNFPYHALVEIKFPHCEGTVHIPLPFFNENEKRQKFVLELPISEVIRDDYFFHCPICGKESFYAGICQSCFESFEKYAGSYVYEPIGNFVYNPIDGSYVHDGYFTRNDGDWIDGPLPIEYRNHEALKADIKKEFLRRLDVGIETGIISAQIIFADRDYNKHWNIPEPDSSIPLGEIIADAWQIIDRFIEEGKIKHFIRGLQYQPKAISYFIVEKEGEFDNFESELFKELGYKFDLRNLIVAPIQTNEHSLTCNRCGSTDIAIHASVQNKYICSHCAREDPVHTLKQYNVYEKGIFKTDTSLIDPDIIETMTRYMEVPKEAYIKLFLNHVPALVIKCRDEDGIAYLRYFVLPPELANIPGYPPEDTLER